MSHKAFSSFNWSHFFNCMNIRQNRLALDLHVTERTIRRWVHEHRIRTWALRLPVFKRFFSLEENDRG